MAPLPDPLVGFSSNIDYIVMFYNSKRLHSHNGYATPAAAEREYAKAHDAA